MTDARLLELIDSSEDWLDRPFVTAKEIAEKVDISRQAAYQRLQQLSEDGRIRKYKPGRSAIWWRD